MDLKRILKHSFYQPWLIRRMFPRATLNRITAAIKESERLHSGQVVFAIEPALDFRELMHEVSPRNRAIDVFSRLRVWDTDLNNGVLVYVLLADRDVEIVADRAANAAIGQAAWESICAEMENHFRAGKFEDGALTGISRISALLAEKFPERGPESSELPDRPVII